jgi:hypothetical protein
MKEFRLVFYMNATEAIDFIGGRAAASPLAYYFYLNRPKHKEVILSGSFRFIGLGRYQWGIKEHLDRLQENSEGIKLPQKFRIGREEIRISDRADIYQNADPLFSQAERQVYWKATIESIGQFKRGFRDRVTLGAVRIGGKTYYMQNRNDDDDQQWCALVSELARLKKPVDKDLCPWKVYGGNSHERNFWNDRGLPSIPRNNVFVHQTGGKWAKCDASDARKKLDIKGVTNFQIRHTRIRESLVHELLKMTFAREGWWVNFEVPISDGRIDFMVKPNRPKADWTIIEVKLEDNPNAVDQLHTYIQNIVTDVRAHPHNSYFWPLWKGGRKCIKPKGVVLCAAPGDETRDEVKASRYGFDVWTYKYSFRDNMIGLVIRDAKTNKLILRTR